MNQKHKHLLLLWALLTVLAADAQKPLLQQTFQNPPNTARPRVWWHWMNGNVTKNGIQKDLEWMHRIGIGGFQNFDANLFTPLVTDKKLVYMTPEWKDAFRFTTQQADRLGLEMTIAASPGWSVTGGPWVPAENGMKKYVWTETRMVGGQPFSGKLPAPPSNPGQFQNTLIESNLAVSDGLPKPPDFYRDAAVVAYRVPEKDKTLRELNPVITASGGTFQLDMLTDGDLATTAYLPPMQIGEQAWIQFAFDQPQTFRALTIVGGGGGPNFQFFGGGGERSLAASDDGVHFREILKIPVSGMPQNTVCFPATTARYFRVQYKTLPVPPNPFAAMIGMPMGEQPPHGTDVAEIRLHTVPRIERLEEKAGFSPTTELPSYVTPETTDAVSRADIVDLSSRMRSDGSLDWTPPAGNWVVIRLGYSLTGRYNHPASPEATGLEVDKLDGAAVKAYFENYLDQYKSATGGLMGKRGLQNVVIDSYEAGGMTWTAAMPAEFERRRGYSLLPWLPVLTGQIVENTTASERFLWDFRKTIADLIAENHYDQIGDLLHKRGMRRYTESHEDRRALIADGMEIKRKADFPMSAMWTPGSFGGGTEEGTRHKADIRESASVAHIYGQNIVAAESLTSIGNAFSWSPEKLKRTADAELAAGLNRFVIHTSVHQPLDDKFPGFSLGPFGQYFTRHETWAEQARPWVDYLSRSSYLLQQGKMVADVLWFYGEDNNITSLFGEKLPDVPVGYNYDFVNADALINVIKAQNGRLVAPSGMTYRLLVLDENARSMSLPVLKKLRDLVKAGVPIAGIKPEKMASLSGKSAEFDAILNEIWAKPAGNVHTGQALAQVLQQLKISPDFQNLDSVRLEYVHRSLPDGTQIYWVDNRSEQAQSARVSFRTTGRAPEFWNPETGKVSKAGFEVKSGRTEVALDFEPWEAYFVVFREKTTAKSRSIPKKSTSEWLSIQGPWRLTFPEKRGAPASAEFATLQSWTEHSDPGIRYFSGTATYSTTFTVNELPALTQSLLIDLGSVKNVAEVLLNGKSQGIAWKTPFRLPISGLKKGDNTLEVRVSNLWVNRLIGDAQPETKEKITFTTMPFYKADAALLPSGLLGPVKIEVRSER
ncbi:MAG: hypothetical protein JNM22_18080 [Saprospiraceae bacterium]|nr:hypothetical protein [Saprospiraceae bacterium]